MREIANQLRAGGFRELAGSHLTLRLSLAETLLNRALAEALAARGGRLRELRVRPAEGNRAIVHVRLARPAFLPPIGIDVQIYRQPVFPADAVLVLRWSSLPGVAALASFAANFFDVLPAGIRIMNELIAIDLRLLLAQQGWSDLLPLIERMEIGTRAGAVVVTLEVRVA